MTTQHILSTLEHKKKVGDNMAWFSNDLFKRAVVHDNSKFGPEEAPYFEENIPKLAGLEYGSNEYKKTLGEIRPALDHHYANNSHHPEYHNHGIDDMTLMDVVEMFCDWKAAVERHTTGDIHKSIEINRKRFKMSDQLAQIFINTVNEMNSKVVPQEGK